MRISYWSSDVCSSDLFIGASVRRPPRRPAACPACRARRSSSRICERAPELTRQCHRLALLLSSCSPLAVWAPPRYAFLIEARSEEHTSELQSLMRISYSVCCLTTKKPHKILSRYVVTRCTT